MDPVLLLQVQPPLSQRCIPMLQHTTYNTTVSDLELCTGAFTMPSLTCQHSSCIAFKSEFISTPKQYSLDLESTKTLLALLVLVPIYNFCSITHILCIFSCRCVLHMHAVLISCPSPCKVPFKIVVGHLHSMQGLDCPYGNSLLRVRTQCDSKPCAHCVTSMLLHRQGPLLCLGHMMMVPWSRTVSLSSLWGSTMVPFRKTSSCKRQQEHWLSPKASLLRSRIAT